MKLYLDPRHAPPRQAAADIVILHAAQPPPGSVWRGLFAGRCVAVARAGHPVLGSPRAVSGAGPASMLRGRLVHIAHEKGPAWGGLSWHNRARTFGLAGPVPVLGPTVSAEPLAVDPVLAEDAFALVSRVTAVRLIDGGRLIAVAGSEVATGCSYWARPGPAEHGMGPLADAFMSWIVAELDLSQSAAAALTAPGAANAKAGGNGQI